MKAQEEEMRQNLEELEATQEDLQRKTNDKEIFEKKLKTKQLFLKNVIDSVPEAVYVKDTDLNYILVNKLFCKLTGKQKEDLLGKKGENLFPENSPLYYKTDKKTFVEKIAVTSQGSMDNPDGKSCTFQLTKNIFKGEDGNEYLIGSVTTIEA
jgi:PAS domain S-box-containing protein